MKKMFFKFLIIITLIKLTACDIKYNDLPVDKGDAPLVVETLINLEKVSSFNLKELDYSMIYFQEQFWQIKRGKCDYFYLNSLKNYLNVNITAGKRSNRKYNINLSNIAKLNIWVPNSFQIDSKQISRIPLQNELLELTIEEDYCYFNLRTRLNVKVGCQMYFKNYPNDIQICPFRFTSYTYPLDSVVYKWRSPGVITNRLVKQINQYTLSISKYQYNSTKYDDKVKFSFLEINLRFENHLSHYLMQIVLPTYFIISIVYLNFWMKADGSPGRFLLTILTFISLVTIYTSNRDKLPALSYANALDIFFISNLFFVFIAISELVFNSFRIKRRTKKQEAKLKQVRTPSSEIYIITPPNEDLNTENKLRNGSLSNLAFNNTQFNNSNQSDLNKSHDNINNINSEIVTVSSSNNLLTLGKETSLNYNSTINSSIENVLHNVQMKRRSTCFSAQTAQLELEEEKKHTINLDKMFRIWYPIIYVISNILYWILLLNRWFDAKIFSSDDDLIS